MKITGSQRVNATPTIGLDQLTMKQDFFNQVQ